MRGCRKERSPAGRPDNNAGHAEWSLHPHAHRPAVGTEKHSVGTALPNAGFHLNGAITALPTSDKGIFAEHLIRRLRIEIGRASCRERGCQYVSISVVADQ